MTHPILANHPDFVAHEEKVAKLDEAENAWRERSRAASDDYQRRLAAHREAKAAALFAGEPPPPEPKPPAEGGPDEARMFFDRRSALRAERRDLLAKNAGEIEAAAAERIEKIADEARPLLAELEGLAAEADQLVAAVRSCLIAKEREQAVPAGMGIGDRMRHTVSVLDLAAAVVDGSSLLAPVTPEQPRRIAASFESPEEKLPTTRDAAASGRMTR